MDLICFLLWILPVISTLLCFFLFFDADITTILMEKFGKNLESQLQRKVIWITGASTGIGAALAVEAAKLQCKIVLSARNKELLEDVSLKCQQAGANKDDILVLPLDMCDMTQHKAAYNQVKEKFGCLDVMVHNAGRSQRARWEYTDIEVDREIFELNVFSVINLTRIILPDMIKKKTGTIAVMSSVAGKVGAPFSGSYTGSKHALHGYFESLRNEKIGDGISLVMLCPGPTFSNLLQVAATEKPKEKFGQNMKVADRRMTAERCAKLSLVAIANKIPESWIAFFPVLPLMYCRLYFPSLSIWVLNLLGSTFLARLRDSRNAMDDADKDK